MNVVFDGRYLQLNTGGIHRETVNLLENLIKKFEPSVYLSRNQNLPSSYSDLNKIYSNLTRRESNLYTLFSKFPQKIETDSHLILSGVSNLNLIRKGNRRTIVRLHDIFPITNPEWFHPYQVRLFRINLENLHMSNATFVCDSNFTRTTLQSFLGDNISTVVVPCFVVDLSDEKCASCEGCDYINQKRSYFLSVGTIEPRKDYPFLIRALSGIDDIDIVIVGKLGWKSTESLYAFKSSVWVRHIQTCCDGSLAVLYRGAKAFISTSYQEGFNLPAMEARKSGIPLLLRQNEVHKEFHSKSATFFKFEWELNEIIRSESYNPVEIQPLPEECINSDFLIDSISTILYE